MSYSSFRGSENVDSGRLLFGDREENLPYFSPKRAPTPLGLVFQSPEFTQGGCCTPTPGFHPTFPLGLI